MFCMEITKEKLQELYSTKKNKEICELLGITNKTLVKYLIKLGIPLKGKGYVKKLIIISERSK